MKKITYLMILALLTPLLGLGLASCDDNTDFSQAHVLTDAELAELARQKHIADSLAQIINADTILVYTVSDYPSVNGVWSSTSFEVDFGAFAEVFGLTEQEVEEALDMAPGCAEFTNVVIQGTTHADQSTNSQNRSNGYWGHWYKFNGNATEAGYSEADSRFYVEWQGYYDEEAGACTDSYFNVGQFPDRSVAGDKYQAIECFIYNEKRVAVVVEYNIIPREEITGGVVATYSVDMECVYNGSYKTTSVEFDMARLLGDLGASSWSDIKWVGINPDGSYTDAYTAGDEAGNEGFWFDQDGYVGAWGDAASVFACFPTEVETSTFTVAPMPDVFTVGNSVALHFAAVCGDKIAEFVLSVTMVEADAIVGDIVYTANYSVKQAYRNDYSYSLLTFDADAVCSALGVGNITDATILGKDGSGKYSEDYSASPVGFWYSSDGALSYTNGVIFVSHTGDSDPAADEYSTLRIGMMPCGDDDPNEKLQPISVVFAFYADNKIAELNIDWQLGEADEGFTAAHDYAADIAVATNAGNKDLTADCEWNSAHEGALIEFSVDEVKTALGIDDLSKARRFALQPDNTVIYQGEDPAYWYGADGNVAGYGADARIFVAYYGYDAEYPEDEYTLYTGLMPPVDNNYTCRVGDTYKVVYGLYANGKTYTFTINATVTGEETPLPAESARRSVNLRDAAHGLR